MEILRDRAYSVMQVAKLIFDGGMYCFAFKALRAISNCCATRAWLETTQLYSILAG